MKLVLVHLALLSCAHAAVITGSGALATNTTTATDRLLPNGATADWGFWNPGNGTLVPSMNATNTSNAGSQVFTVTAVTAIGAPIEANSVRSSTSGANTYFSYSNGGSPLSASDVQFGGVFNGQIGTNGINSGIQMSLTGFTAPTTIQLWVYAYEATAQLTALVNDTASSFTATNVSDTAATKPTTLFTFTFTPDSASDVVKFRYIMSSVDDASVGNAGFVAVALTPIPEPSSVALLGAFSTLAVLRRRRR